MVKYTPSVTILLVWSAVLIQDRIIQCVMFYVKQYAAILKQINPSNYLLSLILILSIYFTEPLSCRGVRKPIPVATQWGEWTLIYTYTHKRRTSKEFVLIKGISCPRAVSEDSAMRLVTKRASKPHNHV